MVVLNDVEKAILLKIYDICFISLNDEVYTGLLTEICSKHYLYQEIIILEIKGMIKSYMDGRKKYVYFTLAGQRVARALNTIRSY